MKNDLQELLTTAIQESIGETYPDTPAAKNVAVEFSLSSGFGDLSVNTALRLSALVKKPPKTVAAALACALEKRLEAGSLKHSVEAVKAEGAGFINVYLRNSYFHEQLRKILSEGGSFAAVDIGKKKKVLIEFVSANPTGPLSVAHARQAAVGDALANILAFLGFSVEREYYLNDEGNQINILGKSIELRIRELAGEKVDFPENHYQGDYIYELAKKAAHAHADVSRLPEFGAEDILCTIKKELNDFRVQFDTWYSQKGLRESGKIEKAFEYLKEKGFLFQQDGALWFKSTLLGDDKDRVVIKSDGSYTYLAPDIAYHREKYARGFQWLINLWGPDHHGYISRLKAAVQALGHDADSLSVVIVQLASIFKDGKPLEMSTRKGQYITLQEVLDEIGVDASRFFFLMRKTSSHLSFDLETAKKQTPENPVYYVQYAHARISSILRNAEAHAALEAADVSLLKEKEEIGLIKKLWQASYIMQICYKTVDPYMLTVYVQELAEAFHRFYDAHRVLGEDKALTNARLSLIYAAQVGIATGLQLLGVSRPEKM